MRKGILAITLIFLLVGCKDTDDEIGYMATPVDLEIPQLFEDNILPPVIPEDNPLTEEGIALGQKLFFDPILSANNTQACADCHRAPNAFTDPRQFSVGIDGSVGTRNSMPLFNLAWNYGEKFFWDGRANSLEEQILDPVTNPIEMANTWPNAVSALESDAMYPQLFEEAFGVTTIDSTLVTKAIAQFLRTLVSSNSKFDRYLLGEN